MKNNLNDFELYEYMSYTTVDGRHGRGQIGENPEGKRFIRDGYTYVYQENIAELESAMF